MIKVKLRTILQFTKIIGKEKIEISVPKDCSIEAFFSEIVNIWGDELASILFEPNNPCLLPHIVVMINGRNIRVLDNKETVLQEGDEILILPPVAGG